MLAFQEPIYKISVNKKITKFAWDLVLNVEWIHGLSSVFNNCSFNDFKGKVLTQSYIPTSI